MDDARTLHRHLPPLLSVPPLCEGNRLGTCKCASNNHPSVIKPFDSPKLYTVNNSLLLLKCPSSLLFELFVFAETAAFQAILPHSAKGWYTPVCKSNKQIERGKPIIEVQQVVYRAFDNLCKF